MSTDVIGIVAFVIIMCAGIAAATVLTINGHWGIALLIMLVCGSVHIKTNNSSASQIAGESSRDTD